MKLNQTVNDVISKYIEKMKEAVDGPEIDTLDIMSNFALDITLSKGVYQMPTLSY